MLEWRGIGFYGVSGQVITNLWIYNGNWCQNSCRVGLSPGRMIKFCTHPRQLDCTLLHTLIGFGTCLSDTYIDLFTGVGNSIMWSVPQVRQCTWVCSSESIIMHSRNGNARERGCVPCDRRTYMSVCTCLMEYTWTCVRVWRPSTWTHVYLSDAKPNQRVYIVRGIHINRVQVWWRKWTWICEHV